MPPKKKPTQPVPEEALRRSSRQHESSSTEYDTSDSKFVVLLRKRRTIKKPPSPDFFGSESPVAAAADGAPSTATSGQPAARSSNAGVILDVVAYGNHLREVVERHDPFRAPGPSSSEEATRGSELVDTGDPPAHPAAAPSAVAMSAWGRQAQHLQHEVRAAIDGSSSSSLRDFNDTCISRTVLIRTEQRSELLATAAAAAEEMGALATPKRKRNSSDEGGSSRSSCSGSSSFRTRSSISTTNGKSIASAYSGAGSNAVRSSTVSFTDADGSAFCVVGNSTTISTTTTTSTGMSHGTSAAAPSEEPHEMEFGDRHAYLWDTIILLREMAGDLSTDDLKDEIVGNGRFSVGNDNILSDGEDSLDLDKCMGPADNNIGACSSKVPRFKRPRSERGRSSASSFITPQTGRVSASQGGARAGDKPRSQGIGRDIASAKEKVVVRAKDNSVPSRSDAGIVVDLSDFTTQAFRENYSGRQSVATAVANTSNDDPAPPVIDGSSPDNTATEEVSRTVRIAREALMSSRTVRTRRRGASTPSYSSINESLHNALLTRDQAVDSTVVVLDPIIPPISAAKIDAAPEASIAAAPDADDQPTEVPSSASSRSSSDAALSVLDLIQLEQGRAPGYRSALHPSLLLDAFGLFFEDMKIFAPDAASPNGSSKYLHTVDYSICELLCREMSKSYKSSHDRLALVQPLLNMYFGARFESFSPLTPTAVEQPVDNTCAPSSMCAISVQCGAGSANSAGSGDLCATSCILAVQNEMGQGQQALSEKCATEHFKRLLCAKNIPLLYRSICPVVFILISGPYLCIQLACVPDRARVDHATAFIPLIRQMGDLSNVVQVAVVLRCVKLLIGRLAAHYKSLDFSTQMTLSSVNQLVFPYPKRFRIDQCNMVAVQIEYLRQLKPSRLLFCARVVDVKAGKRHARSPQQQLVVKFTRTYSPEAHRCCLNIDRSAPELWSCTAMPGGWFMVVMEYIEPSRAAGEVPVHVVKARLKCALFGLHCAGFVHGDVRVGNVVAQISPTPSEEETVHPHADPSESCPDGDIVSDAAVNETAQSDAASTHEMQEETGCDARASANPSATASSAATDPTTPHHIEAIENASPTSSEKSSHDDSSPRGQVLPPIPPRLRVCLLDFDHAGKVGEARYPAFMNRVGVQWPQGAREGGLIEPSHDVHMLTTHFADDSAVDDPEAIDTYGHGDCFDDCKPDWHRAAQAEQDVDTSIHPMSYYFLEDDGNPFSAAVIHEDPTRSVFGSALWAGTGEDSQSSFTVPGIATGVITSASVAIASDAGDGSAPLMRGLSTASSHRETQESSSTIELDALDFINSWT